MAQTGILLRGDIFSTIYADPVVAREVALAGNWLTIGTDDGSGGVNEFYLNLAALSRIGKLLDDQGNGNIDLKTSNLPIIFDAGLFKEQADHILIKNNYRLYFEALGFKNVTSSTIVFEDDTELDIDYLIQQQTRPIIEASTSTDITLDWNSGTPVVFNETTKTDLGTPSTPHVAHVYSVAPSPGDIISVCLRDADYNYGRKRTVTIS